MTADQRDIADDGGFSLIEVIVAGAISLVVIAAGLSFFVNSLRATDDTTSSSVNLGEVRNTLDAWSSLIRVADSPSAPGTSTDRFVRITADSLVFYANLGNRAGSNLVGAPEKIELSVSDGQLIEKHYAASTSTVPYTYPDTPTTTRRFAGCNAADKASCLLPGSVDTSSRAFVPYYPQSATCPADQVVNGTLCKIDTGSPARVSNAVAIGISLTVASRSGRQTRAITTLASVTGGAS